MDPSPRLRIGRYLPTDGLNLVIRMVSVLKKQVKRVIVLEVHNIVGRAFLITKT